MSRALIFVNGLLADPGQARSLARPDDVIFAADGGARHAIALGLVPVTILGDLDSLTPDEIKTFVEMGIHVLRYPPMKDETDFELALRHVIRANHHPILVLGAYGGRLDQSLGNLALIAAPEAIAAEVRLDDGITEAFFISSHGTLTGTVGDLVSLIPWGVPAEAVHTEGLSYPLSHETLQPFHTRGISNLMLGETARISLKQGLLLCVHQRKPSSG